MHVHRNSNQSNHMIQAVLVLEAHLLTSISAYIIPWINQPCIVRIEYRSQAVVVCFINEHTW